MSRLLTRTLLSFALASLPSLAAAQARGQTAQAPALAAPADRSADPPAWRIIAYVEAFYQYNFNRPSNDLTNYRGFDNRHNTFTLSNVALGAAVDYRNVLLGLTLQVGHTPSTYYRSEPAQPGASGANASDSELWKYVQEAYAGYRFIDSLSITAGLFLSPIGPESMAINNNWNWSRSNLFFGLPFYHTGARATYVLLERWAFTLAAYNGWNSVVDNNGRKSLSAQVTYTAPRSTLSLLYFGGVERPAGAPEGHPWRSLFDAHARWDVLSWLALMAHANAGFERGELGNARWAAGAVYARAQLIAGLFVALRGDAFFEHTPAAAQPIFWPVSWVSSGTLTLEYRLVEHVSFRAEYRHDRAQGAMYFAGAVSAAASGAFIANTRLQNTATVGVTAWF